MSYIVDTVELKKAMVEKGIETYGELSEISGVGRDTISGVVRGLIRPSTSVMDKIIIALELEPSKAGAIFFKPNLRNA